MEFNGPKLTDVGKRYRHYTELLDAWESGLEITKRHSYQSDHDQDRIKLLEAGIELLKKEIESKSNVDYEIYRLRDVIDAVHQGAKS